MEVDFVSCFEATTHCVWLMIFIYGLRVANSIYRPLKLYCDNSATIFMTKNNKSGIRSIHIHNKYLVIRECVKENKVLIEHVSTKLMITDHLTKGMPTNKFKDRVIRMRLSSIM